ncbi:MAG: hypothetical protein V2I43_26685, partial [Parvularcula sp.]|nr:hypothetical protein [Parvularcula sp.]
GQDAVPEIHVEALKRSRALELATAIKGQGLPKGSRLLKIYATSPEGARRVVHLLAVEDETLFLLFYRDKKDAVGANITIKNPDFRKQLHKHLRLLQSDLEAGDFEAWEDESKL